MGKAKAWQRVEAEWRQVILVCRKCSKKLGGGFGEAGNEKLGAALRRSLRASPGDKVRRRTVEILDVNCLDVCPKGAVMAIRGEDPGTWFMVPAGAPMAEVASRLGVAVPCPDLTLIEPAR